MQLINKATVLWLHAAVIEQTGGATGLRDEGALDPALAQLQMSFGGADLHPTLIEKAAALCDSLVGNHPFVDGDKRIGFVATDAFLRANGLRIETTVRRESRHSCGWPPTRRRGRSFWIGSARTQCRTLEWPD